MPTCTVPRPAPPRRLALALLLVAGLILAACGSDAGSPRTDAGPTSTQASDSPGIDPELVGLLTDDEAAAAASSVNAFGLDLHRALMADDSGNIVTSPLSVATLLAMVAAGAGGETEEQMATLLRLDDGRDTRLAALLAALTDTDEVTLAVANSLWSGEGFPLEPDYVSFVEAVYAATLDSVDLGDAATAERIDEWVRDNTEDLIDGIAEDLGLPNSNIVLVLLNAVYFQGEWAVQFDPAATTDSSFTLGDGTDAVVPMMNRGVNPDEPVLISNHEGYEVLRLPYDQGRYAMDVFLPDRNRDLAWLMERLDPDERRAALDGLSEQAASVALPRFELEWDAPLSEVLAALGMEQAFGPGADFTPMSPANPFLSVVHHATYIRVDEVGTEAAAVTGGAMATSVPPSFTVDRPFLFTVTDTDTDAVLFLGTVVDPRG